MTGSFTVIVLCAFLRHESTAATIREWIANEPNCLKRAIGFAEALREHFEQGLDDEQLLNELMAAISERTNWGRTAEELLARVRRKVQAGFLKTRR